MTPTLPTLSPVDAAEDLRPHLLYRSEEDKAHFAIWRLEGGPQALAIFTTAETAAKYRAELDDPTAWTAYQPPRATLLEILTACLPEGIGLAALDPASGSARTLFDLAQVVAAAQPRSP
jgi:hypothetical protein